MNKEKTSQRIAAGVAIGAAGIVVGLAVPGFWKMGKTLVESVRGTPSALAPAVSATAIASAPRPQEVEGPRICVTRGDVNLKDSSGRDWVSDNSVPVVIPMNSHCVLTKSCPSANGDVIDIVLTAPSTSAAIKKRPGVAPTSGKRAAAIELANTIISIDSACSESEVTIGGALDHTTKGPVTTITADVESTCVLQLVCDYDGGTYTATLKPQSRPNSESAPGMVLSEKQTPAKK